MCSRRFRVDFWARLNHAEVEIFYCDFAAELVNVISIGRYALSHNSISGLGFELRLQPLFFRQVVRDLLDHMLVVTQQLVHFLALCHISLMVARAFYRVQFLDFMFMLLS